LGVSDFLSDHLFDIPAGLGLRGRIIFQGSRLIVGQVLPIDEGTAFLALD
jgi:hypothetical protein